MQRNCASPSPRHLRWLLLLMCVFFTGCATTYYSDENLNHISVGDSKENLLNRFRPQNVGGQDVPSMKIRAARRDNSGKLLEVGEVPLTAMVGREKGLVYFWFLFENGRLTQWGRPEDWRAVGRRYEINFNPTVGVQP